MAGSSTPDTACRVLLSMLSRNSFAEPAPVALADATL
jgi:hypothetical protein